MTIQVQPIYSDEDPDLPFPSCVVSTTLNIASLFIPACGTLDLPPQQGDVGMRAQDYKVDAYRTQFLQLEQNPQAAIVDVPSTLLLYSIATNENETNVNVKSSARLPEKYNDPATQHSMHHAQCAEVWELINHLKPHCQNPPKPDNVDASIPCELFAWALDLMSQMTSWGLCYALLEWERQKKHVNLGPIEIDGLCDVELYKYTHELLMRLTTIRLACVEGTKRMFTVIYVFTESPIYIGLPVDTIIGNEDTRASVRSEIQTRSYGIRVFVPPPTDADDSGIFGTVMSLDEVECCRQVGVSRQRNMEHATSMSLIDKVVNYARRQASRQCTPWKNSVGNGTLVRQWKEVVQYVFPVGMRQRPYTQELSGWKGIRGKAETSVKTILEHVMKCESDPARRKGFVRDYVPVCMHTRFVAHLRHNNFSKWETLTDAKGGLRENTLRENSSVVAAYHAMLFGCQYIQKTTLPRLLSDLQGSNFLLSAYSSQSDSPVSDEVDQSLLLALSLAKHFFLPAAALLHGLELNDRRDNKQSRCQWMKYMRESAVYAELHRILSYRDDALVQIGPRRIHVTVLCFRLGVLISQGSVVVFIPAKTISGSQKIVATDPGTRIYPQCSLPDFAPRYRVSCSTPETGGPCLSLEDIVQGCPANLANLLLSIDKDESQGMSPAISPFPERNVGASSLSSSVTDPSSYGGISKPVFAISEATTQVSPEQKGQFPDVTLHTNNSTSPTNGSQQDTSKQNATQVSPDLEKPQQKSLNATPPRPQRVPLEDGVGRSVKYFSKVHRQWLSGKLTKYDFPTGRHNVQNDFLGIIEKIDLRQHQWMYIGAPDVDAIMGLLQLGNVPERSITEEDGFLDGGDDDSAEGDAFTFPSPKSETGNNIAGEDKKEKDSGKSDAEVGDNIKNETLKKNAGEDKEEEDDGRSHADADDNVPIDDHSDSSIDSSTNESDADTDNQRNGGSQVTVTGPAANTRHRARVSGPAAATRGRDNGRRILYANLCGRNSKWTRPPKKRRKKKAKASAQQQPFSTPASSSRAVVLFASGATNPVLADTTDPPPVASPSVAEPAGEPAAEPQVNTQNTSQYEFHPLMYRIHSPFEEQKSCTDDESAVTIFQQPSGVHEDTPIDFQGSDGYGSNNDDDFDDIGGNGNYDDGDVDDVDDNSLRGHARPAVPRVAVGTLLRIFSVKFKQWYLGAVTGDFDGIQKIKFAGIPKVRLVDLENENWYYITQDFLADAAAAMKANNLESGCAVASLDAAAVTAFAAAADASDANENIIPDEVNVEEPYERSSTDSVCDTDNGDDGSTAETYYSCQSHSSSSTENSRKRKHFHYTEIKGFVLPPGQDEAKQLLNSLAVDDADKFLLMGRVAFGPYTDEEAEAVKWLLEAPQK